MPRLTPHERACRALSERDFQVAYVKAARALGAKVAHHYDSRFSDPGTKGYPDLTIILGPHLWFDEMKREKGVVHPEQIGWHDALRAAGHTVYVRRPSDWEVMMARLELLSGRLVPPDLRKFPEPRKRPKKRKVTSTRPTPAP